jgi:two-component system, OmpR family, sensor histidine kinase KdpD
MSGPLRWTGYAWAFGATAACTAVGWLMVERFDPVNIAMVYVLAVVVVALRCSRGAAIAASVLCIVAFNFFFIPPRLSFHVGDAQYLLTFAIMLAVALIISKLTQDVHDRARAQAALEVEAETERVRSALLASISHDLRTPLAVMSGASSTLAEGGERMSVEERRALARSVFHQSREMSERVSKVLQMTRLESGTLAPDRDWASLTEIAGAVLDRLRERLALHRIMVELPEDLPLMQVDAALIEQALGNLLENAAQHTPPGTLVRLRAQEREGEIVVSVEDYGPGLGESDVERIFAKFHHTSAEGVAGGVGLGLTICRAIVRLHQGRAWAEQLPGGGSAFHFTLPLHEAPRVPQEA